MEDGWDFVWKQIICPQIQQTWSNQDLKVNIFGELYMHTFGTSALQPLDIMCGQIFVLHEDHPIFTNSKEKATNLKLYTAKRSLSIFNFNFFLILYLVKFAHYVLI